MLTAFIFLQKGLFSANRLCSTAGSNYAILSDPSFEIELVELRGSVEATVRTRASAFPSLWPTEDGYGDLERIGRPAAMVIRNFNQVPCRAPPKKVCSLLSLVFSFFGNRALDWSTLGTPTH